MGGTEGVSNMSSGRCCTNWHYLIKKIKNKIMFVNQMDFQIYINCTKLIYELIGHTYYKLQIKYLYKINIWSYNIDFGCYNNRYCGSYIFFNY